MALYEVGLVAPPGVLAVSPGDVIRVTSEFDYVGPAVSGYIYTALGRIGALTFDEIVYAQKAFSIPSTPVSQHASGYVDITVPSVAAGYYDLYTKLRGIPGADIIGPSYNDVIQIVAAVPVFTNLKITSYVKA